MQSYHDNLILQFDDDITGNAASNQLVTVFDAGTTVKPALFDVFGSPIANPVTTDSKGNYSFSIANGTYDIVARQGTPDETRRDEFIISVPGFTNGVKNFDTLALAIADTGLEDGDTFKLTADRGNSDWNVVLTTTVTPNSFDIVISTGNALVSFVLIQGNIVDPQAYGCIGDNTADDLLPLQRIVAILEDDMLIRGGKTRTYGVGAELTLRNTSLKLSMMDFNVVALPAATGLVTTFRIDVKSLYALNCDTTGLEDDTGFAMLLDGTDATLATGHYVFDGCFAGFAKSAGIQLRRIKFFNFDNGIIEDISEDHGIAAERTQQFGKAACERIIVTNSIFKDMPGYAVDGHSLHTTVDGNELIDVGHCAKSQLSLFENGAGGTNPMTNVTKPVKFSATNNTFDFDYDRSKYKTVGFVSPEFVFSNSEVAESFGNVISAKNYPNSVGFQLYTMGGKKFTGRDDVYIYDAPLRLSSPPIRYTGDGKYTCDNVSFDIEQFNEHFIQSTGPATEINMIDCNIRLGPVANLDRTIIGTLTEAKMVNYKGNTHQGDAGGIVFRPLFVGSPNIVDDIIITGNHQIDGEPPFIDNAGFKTVIKNNIGIDDIVDTTISITAFAGGGQSSAIQLTSEFNEISVCATGGDSVKLKAAPTTKGLKQIIKNNGAASCNVFPFGGDDLGAGVNVAIALASGSSVTYISLNSATWTSL